ncbi:aminoglycoside phosphotransferase family protein [Kitasatospora sp. LaBMicrA B282]|uniref:aminoglycoside phosphotransferase family protein n=1 Tax=Kitasatospora sp. LaBMicrA B282 TaxID=3420949 RepID=UPI003D0D601B
MSTSEPTGTVDRGKYPDARTPWEQPAWRESVRAWVRERLAEHGLRDQGPWRVRLRPWSVLVRIEVGLARPVWFKASPPAGAFEAGLTAALAHWVPGQVLAPLAVDTDRGWSLLPDGGPLFAELLDRHPADPRAWEEVLRQYAVLQRTVAPHLAELTRLGVPTARTAELPAHFDRLVTGNTALQPAERAALLAHRPQLLAECAELQAAGIADSLDHADLHASQLFAPAPGRFVFFDWGDAALTHPFLSFLVPARAAAERHGAAVLPRLRDAYLEPWTGDGHRPAELRRALALADRLADLGRATAWGRLFPRAYPAGGDNGAAEAARSLLRLLDGGGAGPGH